MANGNLLQAVIRVSEKAAKIARAIREEEHLLSLLVREKKEGEKNPRFIHDFKTLADVLVQEVVKHDLGSEFPDLVDHIHGEESNEFSCLDGETVELSVGDTVDVTRLQLQRILGDEAAADILAQLVHSTVDSEDEAAADCALVAADLELWVDPIDSTAEYIGGGAVESSVAGVFSSGLPCVTVLIGAFSRHSGLPVLGVINQPFHQAYGDKWKGKIFWGVVIGDQSLSSIPESNQSNSNKVVLLSSSESEEVKQRLSAAGYQLVGAAGAGYKLLCVACGLTSAYVLSKPSTFYWDTCGPQAVLRALGGGVVGYSEALRGAPAQLKYQAGHGPQACCNSSGLIAYGQPRALGDIVALLQ